MLKERKLDDYLFFKVFRNSFLKKKILKYNSHFLFNQINCEANGDAFFEGFENYSNSIEEIAYCKKFYSLNRPGFTLADFIFNNDNYIESLAPEKSTTFILTQENTRSQGSVFSNIKLSLESDLLISFQFLISEANYRNKGSDGFAFLILDEKTLPRYYKCGNFLGYHSIPKNKGCVAIEFDTYMNHNEPNGNHISFQGCDHQNELSSFHKFSIDSSEVPFNMKDGITHYVDIIFNKKNTSFSVIIDSFELLKNIYVPDLVGLEKAYFGFTSATGKRTYSKHSISDCIVKVL
ncbi:hypothetical protein RB653_005832 [Dictyostelium firmibasis]|uniref:Legume lectin domain-containing protein n=1 Tax=Dictyostelium firmibasis TaxID=79012 RepID=A0AAN7YTA7_9MYCE